MSTTKENENTPDPGKVALAESLKEAANELFKSEFG